MSWINILPEPWKSNPEVVLVMAPCEAKISKREAPTGTEFTCLEYKGETYGLQVTEPAIAGYEDQRLEFNRHGADMVRPAYRGPLNNVPNKLLMSADFVPLIFNVDKMDSAHLNLRALLLTGVKN